VKLGPSLFLKPVGEHRLFYVMAADAEYGPHLKKRITPLISGVGPIESAISVTATLAEFAATGILPDLVVSLGSAGSATLEHCGVYQAKSVSWRDMDASALGFARGVTPFLDLPAELDLPLAVPDLPQARLSTGANIVSGPAYQAIDADMVDMETFAILRATMTFGVPLIALRGISDGKTGLGQLSDWTDYLHVVDEKLAEAVGGLEAWVTSGGLG